MQIKGKIDGKEQKPVNIPNTLHFEVQKKTRMNIVQSKKVYNRKKVKKVDYNNY